MVTRKALRIVAVAVAGTALLVPAILLADELTRTALFDSAGYVVDGRKFGVVIGSKRDDAVAHLTRTPSLRLHETTKGGTCLMRRYGPDITVDVFVDDSWRHGSVCLASRSGRIEEIAWLFGSP